MPPLVDTEIRDHLAHERKPDNYHYIETGIKNSLIKRLDKSEFNYGAIIQPIVGETNARFGEYEVIQASHHRLKANPYLCVIIDDNGARDIVKARKKFNHILKSLKRTREFIRDCHCAAEVLKRKECLQIVHDMKNVKCDDPNLGALDTPHWRYDITLDEIKSCKK